MTLFLSYFDWSIYYPYRLVDSYFTQQIIINYYSYFFLNSAFSRFDPLGLFPYPLTGPHHFYENSFTFWHNNIFQALYLWFQSWNHSLLVHFPFFQICDILRWNCFLLFLMTKLSFSCLFHIIIRDHLRSPVRYVRRTCTLETDLSLNTGSITC